MLFDPTSIIVSYKTPSSGKLIYKAYGTMKEALNALDIIYVLQKNKAYYKYGITDKRVKGENENGY